MNAVRMNRQLSAVPFRFGRFLTVTLAAAVSCGGLAWAEIGGATDGTEIVPNVQLNNDQLASRFLDQATAGATQVDITSLSAALTAHPNTAFSDWLNAQYAKPANPEDLSLTIMENLIGPKDAPPPAKRPGMYGEARVIRGSLMITDNNNELRRQVAYALSQIFVVSDEGNQLTGANEGMCDWYDLLYRDAFTDFSTILHDVTYHPTMAEFLSLDGNAKAGFYNANSRPDENYAREVMQLFTIGLVQLNPDGTTVVDAQGHSIPTYTQPEITEVARVFTGLKYPMGLSYVHSKNKDGTVGMSYQKRPVRYGRDNIDENRHDTGSKSFLGQTLPAGQNTAKDIDDTLQILCQHPNAGPFFARGMIQRLVTSNPSPAYVKRVAQAFVDGKGDMKTIISAILLDDEARNPAHALQPEYGKLREPWLRVTQLSRGFQAIPDSTTQPYILPSGGRLITFLGQYPLSAPSVFNFYLPNYQSPGIVTERNANATDATTLLVDPEFQIMNSNTALQTPNFLMDLLHSDPGKHRPNSGVWALDLTPQINLAKDPAALVDNINTLLTAGMMSERSKGIITKAIGQLSPDSDPAILKERARMAIYLAMNSPDYAIQK